MFCRSRKVSAAAPAAAKRTRATGSRSRGRARGAQSRSRSTPATRSGSPGTRPAAPPRRRGPQSATARTRPPQWRPSSRPSRTGGTPGGRGRPSRGSGERADQRAACPHPEQRCGEALAEVERGNGVPSASVDPEHVGRADVPAAVRGDLLVTKEPRQPVPERQRAEEIPHQGRVGLDHIVLRRSVWVARCSHWRRSSRLSENASM